MSIESRTDSEHIDECKNVFPMTLIEHSLKGMRTSGLQINYVKLNLFRSYVSPCSIHLTDGNLTVFWSVFLLCCALSEQ